MSESPLGLSVLLKRLTSSKETKEAYHFAMGKVIESIKLEQRPNDRIKGDSTDYIILGFSDGTWAHIYDDGQSCCEVRYTRTDDTLEDFIGSKLLDITIKDAPNEVAEQRNDYDPTIHEVQFLELLTSIGPITFSTHNEHNGYYGGFTLEMRIGVPNA
jgi:hypothetical protein